MAILRSEAINEIAGAIAKAQGEIRGAVKDASNPFFNSRYADLESVWAVIREPFSKNGLAVVQLPSSTDPNGAFTLTTLVTQGIGSALTYYRRYMLAAAGGVYQTDDDANDASGNQAPDPARPFSRPQAQAKPKPQSTQPARTSRSELAHAISKAGQEMGYDNAAMADWCNERYGKPANSCSEEELTDFLNVVSGEVAKKNGALNAAKK